VVGDLTGSPGRKPAAACLVLLLLLLRLSPRCCATFCILVFESRLVGALGARSANPLKKSGSLDAVVPTRRAGSAFAATESTCRTSS